LWITRIEAACSQHNIKYYDFKESLRRSGILLDKKSLSTLAVWEPYSFKALVDVAKRKAIDDGLATITAESEVDRVITRGSLNTNKH